MKIDFRKLKSADELPDSAVFAVTGPEDMSRNKAIEMISGKFLDSGFGDFDCDRIEGDGLSADHALTAWYTLPLASNRRVVIVQDADDAKASELDKIAKAIPGGSGRGCLVIELKSASDKAAGALLKAAGQHGAVIDCPAASDQDARGWILAHAADLGLKFETTAIDEMIKRLGPELGQISHETEKLISYAYPNTTITRADVTAMIAESPEEQIFALIDAVCEGRAGAAIQLLGDLFAASDDARGSAHRTLAMLSRQFRLLWQARLLRDHGFSFRDAGSIPAPVEPLLPSAPNIRDTMKRQSFLIGKYRAQSERLSLRDIGEAFEILADTDMALKGQETSAGGAVADIEMCVLKLASLGSTSKRPKPQMGYSGRR